MAGQPTGQIGRSKLHLAIIQSFNQDELRALCFQLDIDYDDLPPGGRSDKAWELIAYCQRRQRLPELLDRCRESRPNREWDVFLPADPEAEPPFKGLHYFSKDDADIFFGRETLTAELVDYLRDNRFLAVVGASGSGKSSLVRAGLVPALTGRKPLLGAELPLGSAAWPVHIITPTARPLESLAISLTRDSESITAATTLAKDLSGDSRGLDIYARRLLDGRSSGRLLLIVDQFEELFTLCRDEAARAAFLDNLLSAAGPGSDGPAIVVLTLRADFYAHCAQYPALRAALAEWQIYIGQMDAAELRQAIEGPASRDQLELEEGLVEILLRDVGAEGGREPEPGALPLLSHALLETWKRREGPEMTLAGYRASGRVQGAIAQTAERTYQKLNRDQQTSARDIFLRLTELGEGRHDTRRRVSLDEIIPQDERAEEIAVVLRSLADARLVTTDEGVVEVAHEALIRHWPRLREWLDQDRESLRLHRQLTESTRDWLTGERDSGYLYSGARLAAVEAWLPAHESDLNEIELAFVKASLAERDRLAQELEEQRLRKEQLKIEQKNARRFRRLTISAIGLFIIAVIAAGLAVINAGEAEDSAILAQTREAQAVAAAATSAVLQAEADESAAEVQRLSQLIRADQLAAEAEIALETDPELALLLARVASQILIQSNSVSGDVQPTLYAALSTPYRTTLYGHDLPVGSVNYSPGGNQLATAGSDGMARLWDAATGEEVVVLSGHTGEIWFADYSPDGQQLATAGVDGTARLWDVSTGQEMAVLSGHAGAVWSVIYSPDGEQLATTAEDGMARLWDARTREESAILSEHAGAISFVTYSPDGEQLAAASEDGTIWLWDVATGQEVLALHGHENSIMSVLYSPDGEQLASASRDGTARLWDAKTGEQTAVLSGHKDWVGTVIYAPDGQQLATAGRDGTIRLWNATTGQEVAVLSGHTQPIWSMAYSPDGEKLATASIDGTVRLWKTSTMQDRIVLSGHVGEVYSLAYSPEGGRLATAGRDGTTRLWETATGQEVDILRGHERSILSVAYNPDREQLATADEAGTVRLWDLATGEVVSILSGHEGWIGSVVYNPDGGQLATSGVDGTVRLWDTSTGQEVSVQSEPSAYWDRSVAYSPNGKQLATVSTDGTVQLRDITTDQEEAILSGHEGWVWSVVYSPDGQQLATAGEDGTVRLWNTVTGQEVAILSGHTGRVRSAAYSPNGNVLATVGADGTTRLWDVATGEGRAVLHGHKGEVDTVFYRPDGQQLATVGYDGTVRLWNVATGQVVAVLSGQTSTILSAVYSPDGKQLATASDDGTVQLWNNLPNDAMIAEADRRLQRGFTEEECQRYFADDLAACPREPY